MQEFPVSFPFKKHLQLFAVSVNIKSVVANKLVLFVDIIVLHMLTWIGLIEYFFVEKVEAPASHLIDAQVVDWLNNLGI